MNGIGAGEVNINVGPNCDRLSNVFYFIILFIYWIQLQYKLNIQDNHIVEQYNQSKDEQANIIALTFALMKKKINKQM